MQKTNRVILTAVVLGLSADVRAAVAVTNAGFEAPAVVAGGFATSADGWSGTGGNGVAANAGDFGGTNGGALPAPAEGRQFAYLTSGNMMYQQVGTLVSNRLYTLTMAVGRRSGFARGTALIAFRVGGTNEVLASVQRDQPATGGVFEDCTLSFHTFGGYAARAGEALYVTVTYMGSQGAFDNVRLSETTDSPFVNNGDFEFPYLAANGWQYGAPGWTVVTDEAGIAARAGLFTGGTNGYPYPAPATGRQALFINGRKSVYQEIGVVQSNKIHTVNLSLGAPSGQGAGGTCTFKLMDGAWNSTTTLVSTTVTAPPVGTFTNMSFAFSTAKAVWDAYVGHRLFLVVTNDTSAQRYVDTISATLSDPPALSLENAGFENPVVAAGSWSGTVNSWAGSGGANTFGVIAMANEFGGTAGGPMPAPAEGRQCAFVNAGSYLYQDVESIQSNRIYTLTVAQGRRTSFGAGTGSIWLRDNTWNGPDLAATTNATPAAGTFADRTVSFATTNGLFSNAVGHRLFVTLGGVTAAQGAFDNVRLLVQRPAAGFSLSAAAAYTNLATESVLSVTGPYASETDNLITNAATGSVALSQAVPAPTYVMLWLAGGDAAKYSALAAALSAGGATALTVADNDWTQLAKRYSGFNMLVKFPVQSAKAFNWDFGSGYAWDGTVVDQVAVSTKIIQGTMIRIL